jgi:hypothetical protein
VGQVSDLPSLLGKCAAGLAQFLLQWSSQPNTLPADFARLVFLRPEQSKMTRSWLLLICVAVLLAASGARAEPQSPVNYDRRFAVECRLVDASSGKQQVQACPNVTVFEHQRVSIVDLVQRPFVVAVSPPDGNAQQPHIAMLPEGVTFELACHANNAGSVTLDVTIEQSKIVAVEVVQIDDQTNIQQPRVKIAKTRHFAVAKSGEPLTIALDERKPGKSKRWAEFVVREVAR